MLDEEAGYGLNLRVVLKEADVPDWVLYILFQIEIGKEASALHITEINL